MSEWTPVQLLALMDERDKRYQQRFEAQEKALDMASQGVAKATQIAEATEVHYRAQANEWRDAMDDREAQFSRKSEVKAEFDAMQRMVAALAETAKHNKERLDKDEGKGLGGSSVWAVLFAIAMVALGVMGFFLKAGP